MSAFHQNYAESHNRSASTIFKAFEREEKTEVATGNKALELALIKQGKLGVFYSRENGAENFVHITIDALKYRIAIKDRLKTVLCTLRSSGGFTEEVDITNRAQEIALTLTAGVCIMTYLKLHAINRFHAPEKDKYLHVKPKVPYPFEVPAPFALAIQQLGIVDVSSTRKRTICVPTAEKAAAALFLTDSEHPFSPVAYSEAVKLAKKIGIRFTTVDLSRKVGSSWWLYRQNSTSGFFQLVCPLPEDNFTESGAVIHSMFLNDDPLMTNDIFDLSPLGDEDYGSMLRNPRPNIGTTAFLAINDDPEQIWNR